MLVAIATILRNKVVAISPDDLEAGQSAFERVKAYEGEAKKRRWGYFSGAFWTFQICLLGFIRNYNSHSYVGYILPALWLVLLCFITYKAISQSVRYGADLDLLTRLKATYGHDISFESKKEPAEKETAKEAEKWGGLYPLFVFCVFLAAVFGLSYFIHHIAPVIFSHAK